MQSNYQAFYKAYKKGEKMWPSQGSYSIAGKTNRQTENYNSG